MAKFDKTLRDIIQNIPQKLLIALNYRPKLKMKLRTLMEERKMPLTITEEMIRNDPFFKKAKKEDIIKLYQKLKLNSQQIADILDLPL